MRKLQGGGKGPGKSDQKGDAKNGKGDWKGGKDHGGKKSGKGKEKAPALQQCHLRPPTSPPWLSPHFETGELGDIAMMRV